MPRVDGRDRDRSDAMRIEWDPLDVAIATLVGGVVRIHEGTSAREHSRDVLDMRWLADGPIMTIDTSNRLRSTRDGKLTSEYVREWNYDRSELVAATIAAGGDRFVAQEYRRDMELSNLMVETIPPRRLFVPRLGSRSATSRTRRAAVDSQCSISRARR